MGLLSNKSNGTKHGKAVESAQNGNVTRMEAVIGPNSSVNGTFKADGDLRIDGAFEGYIEVLGNVIIGATGRVIATITATNVHVSGALKGEVTASDQFEISHTGKVWGNINAGALHVEPGGVFHGQSAMSSADEPLLLEAPMAVS